MAPFDVAACCLALALVVHGAVKGLARLVFQLGGLALGWLLAARFSERLALRLGAGRPGATQAGPDLLRLAAFALIFIGVTLAMGLAAWAVTRSLGKARLGGFNRLSGACLGLLLAILVCCAATVPLVGFFPPDGGGVVRGALLGPYAVAGGAYLKAAAAEPLRSRFGAASGALMAGSLSEPRREPAPRPR